MHDDIKTFALEGELIDTNIVETKEHLIDFVETMMRDAACVPVLDMEPQFTMDYQPERQVYLFKLTLYGVSVGKEEAWLIGGMTNGKPVMRYTPKHK